MDNPKDFDTDRVIRAWAIERHKNVGKRGRISERLRNEYYEALYGPGKEVDDD